MRRVSAVLFAGVILATLSTGLAQQSPPVVPAVATKRAPQPARSGLASLPAEQRTVYAGTKSGVDWLARVNKPDGRFLAGFQPALRVPLDGDSYLHQASAAWALAQGGAHFEDPRALAVAKQALLTLLLETSLDPQTQTRFTVDPLLSRLASGGLLALAIHALPTPAADLRQQADQLVNYLRTQQQANGAFQRAAADPRGQADDADVAAGWALHAIVQSHAARAEPWKLEALRQGAAHYHARWRQQKNLAMVPPHTAACAEAYRLTKEQGFADAVFEMNDWLCTLQYASRDPRRPHWFGGFQAWSENKAVTAAPDIRAAESARSLVHAYRAARQHGDRVRAERYRAALEHAVQFLGTLQYTEANTQHFADWYRQSFLIGAFFTSHQDGSVRLEGTAQTVAALVPYLQHAVE
jgi:hypothetical protein